MSLLKPLILALLLIGMEVSSGQLVGESASMLPIVSAPRTSGGLYGIGAQPSRVQYLSAVADQKAGLQEAEAQVRESVWRWFLEEEIDYVLCLSWNESRYDRLAVGAAGERGVLQISPYWNRHVLRDMGYTPDDLWDIDRNVQVAAEIRNRWNGFGAWSTRYLCGG